MKRDRSQQRDLRTGDESMTITRRTMLPGSAGLGLARSLQPLAARTAGTDARADPADGLEQLEQFRDDDHRSTAIETARIMARTCCPIWLRHLHGRHPVVRARTPRAIRTTPPQTKPEAMAG